MKKFSIAALIVLCLGLILTGVPLDKAFADGNDAAGLGPPSIAIASGSGYVAAGTGMDSQPGTISFNVPGDVVQVLLYWVGRGDPDDIITVDTTSITGIQIGFTDLLNDSTSFRADITGLGLVGSGANSLTIEDMDFSSKDDGAAVLVIYSTPSTLADIQIRDGNDFAFINLTGDAQVTIPQTFSFAPESSPRTATLTLFVGDGTPDRPDKMQITVDGTTDTFWNLFDGVPDGPEFDALNLPVSIPAGADALTVQLFSEDDPNGLTGIPDSLSWMTAALNVPVTELAGCTPGYWKQEQHFDSWTTYTPGQTFSAVFGCSITIKWSERRKPQEVTNPTLLQALQAKGGGESALARHAVAALLNATNPDVSYPRTEVQIKTMVCNALSGGDIEGTKNTLAGWNEEFCPLD